MATCPNHVPLNQPQQVAEHNPTTWRRCACTLALLCVPGQGQSVGRCMEKTVYGVIGVRNQARSRHACKKIGPH